MKSRPLPIFCCIALVAGLAASGCASYHLGSLAHPQLQSIAVAAVANPTTEPRLSALAAQKIRSRLAQDGSLALAAKGAADCVLHTKIVSYDYSRHGAVKVSSGDEGQRVYRTAIYGVSVKLEYYLTVPGRPEPLLAKEQVDGTAEFSEQVDLDVARTEGFDQAMADAADKLVTGITEAW